MTDNNNRGQVLYRAISRVSRISAHTYVAIGVAALWIIAAAFWATPAFFIIDGAVYHSMIDAFARDGSLIITNGYEEYGSSALRAPLTRIVDGHLVAQYPGGWGILAAPAYLAGGIRGVMLINAVASGLTLLMIWIAASSLFNDRRISAAAVHIYAFSTFAVDYALAFWPHGVATFLTTAAFAAIARGWRGDSGDELRGQFLAGLAVGIAINIRVDAILAAAGLLAWQTAVARRPYFGLIMFAAGLAPGLAAASAINYAKFGTALPFNYGVSRGNASMRSYLPPIPIVGLVALAAMAVGMKQIRSAIYRPGVQAVLLVMVVAIIIFVSPLRTLAVQIAHGFYVLVVDFQAHPVSDPTLGVMNARGLTLADDGTVLMHGLTKKALLQSMPYAVVVIILLPQLLRGPNRAAITLCILFIFPIIGFFSTNTWHGGMSNNMRYFLSFTPVLAILTAAAWRKIAVSGDGRPVRFYTFLLWAGGAAALYAAMAPSPLGFTLQRTLPNILVAGTAAGSVLFILTKGTLRDLTATFLRTLVALGMGVAFISAYVFDIQITQHRRGLIAKMIELTEDLPKDALVVTYGLEKVGIRLNRPPALTTEQDFRVRELDPAIIAMVARAIAEQRPVFAQGPDLAGRLVGAGVVSTIRRRYGIEEEWLDLYELLPPPD